MYYYVTDAVEQKYQSWCQTKREAYMELYEWFKEAQQRLDRLMATVARNHLRSICYSQKTQNSWTLHYEVGNEVFEITVLRDEVQIMHNGGLIHDYVIVKRS